MSLIKRIISIKNFRLFNDFSPSVVCPDFKRYNLIFGLNGSGKTTLADFFNALHQIDNICSDFTLETSGGIINKQNYKNELTNIRVFNRSYIEDSISRIPQGIKPIFYIGKENKDNAIDITIREEELLTVESMLAELKNIKGRLKTEIDKIHSGAAKEIKLLLTANRSEYNGYNRTRLEKTYKAINTDYKKFLLPASELQNLILKQRSNIKDIISWEPLHFNDSRVIFDYVRNILNTFPTNQVIENLKNDPLLSEWVKSGFEYHTNSHQEKCQFCGNPLSKDVLLRIEGHFDRSYNDLVVKIEAVQKKLNDKMRFVKESNVPDELLLYEELRKQYSEAKSEYLAEKGQYLSFLGDMLQYMERKQKNLLDRSIIEEYDSACSRYFSSFSNEYKISEVVNKHNSRTAQFDTEMANTRRLIEYHKISEIIPKLGSYEAEANSIENKLNNFIEAKTAITKGIQDLKDRTYNTRMPAELINYDIEKFFPGINIKLEVEEDGYRIVRNGEIAYNLSDGEITSISLIYFIRSLSEGEISDGNVVVIIDDPAVGLDLERSNKLLDYFKEHLVRTEQIFILTHEVVFNQAIAKWFLTEPLYTESEFFLLDRDSGLNRQRILKSE